jgi:hypothetical protein
MGGMKAPSWITAIILAGILPLNGWARLGETPEQCEERYGSPSITKKEPEGFLPGVTASLYQKAGLAISVIFYRGTAGFIKFEKIEEKEALSPPEIEGLLEANGGGKKWQPVPPALQGPFCRLPEWSMLALERYNRRSREREPIFPFPPPGDRLTAVPFKFFVGLSFLMGPPVTLWQLDDGSATAAALGIGQGLAIATAEYRAADTATMPAKDEENLSGF